MIEEQLFHQALERPAAERGAFLDSVCATDAALRERVEALLRAHENPGSFLAGPSAAVQATIDQPISESPGTVIGPYKLLEQIGEGGFGVVFMAEQLAPVRRRVALKVIRPGMDTREVIARFEAERQALALMDHPNVARVLDAGTTDSGRSYFVMELVKGVPITKYCDEHRLTPRQRLELFLPVCQAIQHAHHKGIIHRDIKPSNVMVCLYDSRPVPKVIDFGVAKATGDRLTEATLFTQFGQVVGTLEYMSPEQAGLNQLDIDTRSDIYSLGVLLYELLTGTTPLQRQRVKEAAFMEVLRLICEEEPARPSTRLSASAELPSIAANRGLEPRKLSLLLRGELDWIVMKSLEKERDRRYETANSLALDLKRYLSDEPVQACPPSAGYRFRKFARRNKIVLTMIAVVAIALLLGTIVSTWQAVRATRAEGLAAERLKTETAALEAETSARRDADAARQETVTQRDRAQRRLYDARLAQSRAARWSGRPGQRFDSLDALTEAAELARALGLGPEAIMELRNEAIACLTLTDVRLEKAWSDFRACNPDAEFYAQSVIDQAEIIVRRTGDDGEVARLSTGPGTTAVTVLFSPNGELLAATCRELGQGTGPLKKLIVWEWRRGQVVFETPQLVSKSTAFSPNSRLIAFAQSNGHVVVHDLVTGREVADLVSGSDPIAFDPAGKQLAVCRAREVRIYDLAGGQLVRRLTHPRNVTESGAWHPDGRVLAAACEDEHIYLWDLVTGKQRGLLRGGGVARGWMSFISQGEFLISGTWTNETHLWDPWTGRRLVTCPGWRAQVSRDGRLLANSHGLWQVAAGPECRTLPADPPTAGTAFDFRSGEVCCEGRWLATSGAGGVCLWDLSQGKQAAFLPIGFTQQASFDPLRRELLTSGDSGLHRWPFQIESEVLRVGPPERLAQESVSRFGLDRESRTLAVSHEVSNGGQGCWVLDLGDPTRDRQFFEHRHATSAAVSPDGRWVATGTWHGREIKIWDAQSGQVVHQMSLNTGKCTPRFSPDGRWLVAFTPTEIDFLEIGSWTLARQIPRPGQFFDADDIVWTRDGTVGAFPHSYSQIQLFDAAAGRDLAILEPGPVGLAGFSPDGSQLVTFAGRSQQYVRIWNQRLIRQQLAEMGLDWDMPPYPPAVSASSIHDVQVEVDLGPLAVGFADDKDREQARSESRRGDALRQQGKLAEAVVCYRKVLQLEPQNAKILNRLAWLLAIGPAENRDAAECLKLAQEACRLDPDSPYILHTLGAAQCRAGGFREALGSLERVGGNPDFLWRTQSGRQFLQRQSFLTGHERVCPCSPHLGLKR